MRAVRRDQLKDAKRGVDLLLAHLKGTDDSLYTALATQDADAASACADPLMTMATILIRMLRDATTGTVPTALALARTYVDTQIPTNDIESVEGFISDLISGKRPRPISTGTVIVALVAQEIALGAATELAKIEGKHLNAVVANLRVKLANQGDEVQISDREAAIAASEEYAADVEMREARQAATSKIVNHWNDAANVLHYISTQDGLPAECKESLTATSLMAVTCAALNGGIYQLAEQANLYPAMALLRQLVEAEFILWKFAQDPTHIRAWLNSTPEERRLHWRPAAIYRDGDNEYRQKDYAMHCELCGHPTPVGTRMAAGVLSFISMAGLLSDQINHSKDAWQHFIEAVELLDNEQSTNFSASLESLDSAFKSTLAVHSAVDLYGYSTAFFSDPIDDD